MYTVETKVKVNPVCSGTNDAAKRRWYIIERGLLEGDRRYLAYFVIHLCRRTGDHLPGFSGFSGACNDALYILGDLPALRTYHRS